MALTDFFRINLPYGIVRDSKGRWSAFNREYLPLGWNEREDSPVDINSDNAFGNIPIHTEYEKVTEKNGFVASYIHAGGKIGVLVDVETDVINDAVKEMARNVAMQAAALKPTFTNRDEVSPEFIEHEKAILIAQIQNDPKEASKPEKVIQGMIQGRINKELKEFCLMDQVYVKAEDGKQSVSQYVASVAKANNANITIKKFVRFETGEGMEKKEENFAEEVAKQMGK